MGDIIKRFVWVFLTELFGDKVLKVKRISGEDNRVEIFKLLVLFALTIVLIEVGCKLAILDKLLKGERDDDDDV